MIKSLFVYGHGDSISPWACNGSYETHPISPSRLKKNLLKQHLILYAEKVNVNYLNIIYRFVCLKFSCPLLVYGLLMSFKKCLTMKGLKIILHGYPVETKGDRNISSVSKIRNTSTNPVIRMRGNVTLNYSQFLSSIILNYAQLLNITLVRRKTKYKYNLYLITFTYLHKIL